MEYNLATAEGQQARIDALDRDAVVVAPDATPLDFLLAVMRDASQPMTRRVKCAGLAANFCHPKLAVVSNINGRGDIGERLDQARKRVEGLEQARAEGRLVEHIREEKLEANSDGVYRPEVKPKPVDLAAPFAPFRRRI